jgi:hypothetical protein
LVVNGKLIDKHLPDHAFFGRALGYPPCCLAFFQLRNNWQEDNHYYASYRATLGQPCWLANGLPRHSACFLAPHIPCSFSCAATVSYSAALLRLIEDEASAYACEIRRRLTNPMLCLSELRLYEFEGVLRANRLSYRTVEPLNPTSQEDDVYRMLREGDECIIEANIVKILRGGQLNADYFARADKYGPEFPFFVQCR